MNVPANSSQRMTVGVPFECADVLIRQLRVGFDCASRTMDATSSRAGSTPASQSWRATSSIAAASSPSSGTCTPVLNSCLSLGFHWISRRSASHASVSGEDPLGYMPLSSPPVANPAPVGATHGRRSHTAYGPTVGSDGPPRLISAEKGRKLPIAT